MTTSHGGSGWGLRRFISLPRLPAPRRRIVLPVALLVALTLVTPIPWIATPVRADTDTEFTFEGGGWGHAVGMSQYGAYGMAKLDGADYETILSHYYSGASLGVLGEDLAAADPLWVNLEREAESITLRSYAISGGGNFAELRRGPDTVVISPGDAIRIDVDGVTEDGEIACRVETTNGHVSTGPCDLDLEWDGNLPDPTTRFAIENVRRVGDTGPGARCTNLDWNSVPSMIRTCTYSRGLFHIRPDDNTASFHLVVEIDVDDYVLGISEMPYAWAELGGLEALKAQIVAARSYAVSKQIERAAPEDRPSCWCSLYDTTVDQRYVGWGHSGAGQDEWIEAVAETAGEVVMHPASTRSGVPVPVSTFYGSSSYGRTEPSRIVFGLDIPYLQSVTDRWALEPTVRNPEARWSKTFTGDELAGVLGWTNRTVEQIDVVACSPSGAASELRFTDAQGAAETVRSRSLWLLLALRSPQIVNVGAPPPEIPPCEGLTGEGGVAGGSITVDDDAGGDSIGNGDGLAQCGETVELRTQLQNLFAGSQTGITASLTTDDPHVTIVHNTVSAVGTLSGGATGVNADDWDLALAADTPDGHRATLRLAVSSDQGGPWILDYELPVGCGTTEAHVVTEAAEPITVAGLVVDDGVRGDSVGNNDQAAQCGEVIELYAAIANGGAAPLEAVEASLATDDPHLTLLHNTTSGYPDLAPGATGENLNDWDIQISPVVPEGHVAPLTITVTTADTTQTLEVELPIECEPPAPPPGPQASTHAVAGITIDDGVRGDSVGNNDKVAQCGEVIELYVTLTGSAATPATATLAVSSDLMTLLYNTSSRYPALNGGTGENADDWDIRIAEATPDGAIATITIDVVDEVGNATTLAIPLPISCPGSEPARPIIVGTITVDDGVRGDSVGNNDKVAQCGELIELYVSLEHRGSQTIDDVDAVLTTTDPYLTLLYNDASGYGTLVGGAQAENFDDWDMAVAATAPNGHVASLRLSVTTASGDLWSLPVELPIRCP